MTLYLNPVEYEFTILRQLCGNPGVRLEGLTAGQRGRAEAGLLYRCRFLSAVRYMAVLSSSSVTGAEPMRANQCGYIRGRTHIGETPGAL